MDTKVLDFCDKYKRSLQHNDEESIAFRVNAITHYTGLFTIGINHGANLITLDDEDLKYLYDKYSKKLMMEMNCNINEISNLYNQHAKNNNNL